MSRLEFLSLPKSKRVVVTKDQFEDFLRDFVDEDFLVLDVEGTLEDFFGFGVLFHSKRSYYVPFKYAQTELSKKYVFEILNSLFKEKERTILGHNIKYDLKVLTYNGLRILGLRNISFEDTQILAWVIDSRRVKVDGGLSLDGLAKAYGIEGKLKKFKEVNFYDVDEVSEYCLRDCLTTYELFETLYEELEDEKLKQIYDLERKLIPYVTLLELRGAVVNVQKIKELDDYLCSEIRNLLEKIKDKTGHYINFNSQRDILRVLPKEIRDSLPDGKTEKSTRKDALSAFKEDEIVNLVLKARSLEKIRNTFGIPLLNKAKDYDEMHKIVYSEFRQDGTLSGRFKSSSPNLQNIPRREEKVAKAIREAFVPRLDYKLVIADASQIELRSLALISKEEKLIEAFRSDGDLHQLTADLLGISRQEAKTVNFSIVYGVSAETLGRNLGLSTKEAEEIIENFFNEYPRVKKLRDYIRHKLIRVGVLRTYFGRKRIFSEIERKTEQGFRQAFNFVCQGTAIDLVKSGMLNCYERGIRAYPILQVHDEICFEVLESEAQKVAEEIKSSLENAPFAVGLPVKIVYDVKIANSWGEK